MNMICINSDWLTRSTACVPYSVRRFSAPRHAANVIAARADSVRAVKLDEMSPEDASELLVALDDMFAEL